MKKAIPYYRVSTDRQGQSGLGLEAQQKAVQDFARFNYLQLLGDYTEVESGRSNTNRPVLQAALVACEKEKAVLVIAKLDRLARNVAFISKLMESKIEFMAVDAPAANKLMVHILAAFAEHEREQISVRTKAALQAAKQRGVELGKYGTHVLSKENSIAAYRFARHMKPVLAKLKKQGFKTIRQLSTELNRLGIPTYRGASSKWHPTTVCNVLLRQKGMLQEKQDIIPLIA